MTVFVDVVPAKISAAPNLTLLHGWGLNGAVWNGLREELTQRYTLHIIDLPGHGRSHGAPVANFKQFLDAVAGALPAKTHLAGWSLGGHTAMALAHRFPDRIEKLVTICATPRFINGDNWPHGKRPEVLADFAKRLGENYQATIRNFLALQALRQPEMRDVIRTLQLAVNSHGAPSVASLAATLDILKLSDLRSIIPTINQLTLIIQGDHDALTSTATAQWLADNLPRSTYCLIEHAAHAPFISHPGLFLDHLQAFLDS